MVKAILAGLAIFFAAAGGAAEAQEFDLDSVDANRDGAVTRAEARGARAAMFVRSDLNQDGLLDVAERQAVIQVIAARAARGLERADANHDGLISRAEFMNQPYRGFDFFDWDRNGVLSPAEITALRARLGQR